MNAARAVGERFDADEVRLAARAGIRAVCEAIGLDVRGRVQLESSRCPAAQHRRRRSCVIDTRKAVWHCLPCASGGDMLDAVAIAHGLDPRRDFATVLAIAAHILGVRPVADDPRDAERRRRDVAERAAAERRRRDLEDRAAAERKAAAIAAAPATWDARLRRHEAGERYLRGRGLSPTELVLRGAVRFTGAGDPSVALRAFDTGEPINVITRFVRGEQKIGSLRDGTTRGTLVDSVRDLAADGADVAVLTEGVADSLAACLAFPGCVVVGANGTSEMERVAAAVAPRVREVGGWLLVVPHLDTAGIEAAAAAVRTAMRAGLELRRSVRVVDLGEAKDLADAWRDGWRWTWPT